MFNACYHHSRPSYSRHAPYRHHSKTERGQSRIRQLSHCMHISISISPSVTSQGKIFAFMASFYVTNLPDHVQYVDLHKAFEVYGILSDVYAARNRNARGQNYDFVRYINVKDVAKL